MKVTCQGDPGHGSRFIENTAAQKIQKVVNTFLAFRDSEEKRSVSSLSKCTCIRTCERNRIIALSERKCSCFVS